MQSTYSTALRDAGFKDEEIQFLAEKEAEHGPVQNWPEQTFRQYLDGPKTVAAHAIIRDKKAAAVTEIHQATTLPEKPPYLSVDKLGNPVGYNPSDPAQFWEDPKTGELWRWDGKRTRKDEGKKNQNGDPIPVQRFKFGQPRRVMKVSHKTIDGVAVPDPQEQAEADAGGYDWFHRGYGVWIGNGGKPYKDVSMDVRRRVRAARERFYESGNPAIQRVA